MNDHVNISCLSRSVQQEEVFVKSVNARKMRTFWHGIFHRRLQAFYCVLLLLIIVTPVMAKNSKGKKEIVLGMSTALTGPTAELGINMKQGVLLGLDRTNRMGGVAGRRLRLLALDDGYEPARTSPNMRRLIEKENVLAVIGNVGTPTAIVAVPIAKEKHVLFYAPFTGAGVLRKTPPDRYVINYRASYAEETSAMIDALVSKAGLQPRDIAFFTQKDGYGDAGYVGGISALKRFGLRDEKSVIHVRYERNTLAVENALARIIGANSFPRAIIMVGAYAPCAKFIALAVETGVTPLFLNVSFVGSAPLARTLGGSKARVIVTQTVPHPDESNLSIVREYRSDLRKFSSSAISSFGSLEGYIATRILVRAMKTIDGLVTRENVIDALEGLKEFDIGLGQPLHLSGQEHQASHQVWPTILRDGNFVPFEWAEIDKLVQETK